jgi:hypothetical protein
MRNYNIRTQEGAANAEQAARRALALLQEARDELKKAQAPLTLARVQSAISSAKGAVRNAGYRVHRSFTAERRDNGEI